MSLAKKPRDKVVTQLLTNSVPWKMLVGIRENRLGLLYKLRFYLH